MPRIPHFADPAQGVLDAYAQWGLGGPPVASADALLRQIDPLALPDFRAGFRARFGDILPQAAFLTAMRPLAPLLEIGSGSGYLTRLLRNAGLDAIATDSAPFAGATEWVDIDIVAPARAIQRARGHRTVLCNLSRCDDDRLADALARMSSGQALVLIGEAPAQGDPVLLPARLRRRFRVYQRIPTFDAIRSLPGRDARMMILVRL